MALATTERKRGLHMGEQRRKPEAKAEGGAKKALPFRIADILKEGRHGEREFSQTRIVELLAEEGVSVHRDTVKANLEMLAGYFPQLTSERRGKFVMWSWREPEPEPVFDASQARYLADGVVTAGRLTPANKAELIELILSNSDAGRLPWDDVLASLELAGQGSAAENPEYLLAVEIVAECIQNGWRVAFRHGEIDRSGKFVRATSDEDEVGPVVPEFLVLSGGTYYLACKFPDDEKRYHYRVDLMHDVHEVPVPGGAGPARMNVGRYTAEHPLMFSEAEMVTVRVRDDPRARLHFFDHFSGGRVTLASQGEGFLTYEVRADPKAAAILACQFAGEVEVLAPQEVRDAVAESAAWLAEAYAAGSDREGAR